MGQTDVNENRGREGRVRIRTRERGFVVGD